MEIYKQGDYVQVMRGGQEIDAQVMLASPNGRSLMLMFDGAFLGYVGRMPLVCEEGSDTFVDLIEHRYVLIRRDWKKKGVSVES